jgi:predicted nuclease of predicted toxin-antitoxin system
VLDENLSGKSILVGLADAGVPARPQTDFYERETKDPEVFAALATHPDCYLLTKDKKFHRKPAEREALIRHGIGAFIITMQKDKSGPELVELIREAWPRIERYALENPRPFIARILAEGRIERRV